MNATPERTPRAPAGNSTKEEILELDAIRVNMENAWDQFIDILRARIEIEKQAPGREKLRQRMQRVEKIADEIVRELKGNRPDIPRISDPPVFPLERELLNDDENWLPQIQELYADLNFLMARCRQKRSEMPSNKGRSKLPVDGAKFLCALMASAIFEFAYKRLPGHTNKRAHKLCSDLWRGAGGPTTGQFSDTHSGWRNHLQSALAAQSSWEAKSLQKMIGLKDQISGDAKKT